MTLKPLTAFWRWRVVRAAVGLLVLAGAAYAQYRLANVPRLVNVEATGYFSPATIRLGQEELVIEGPLVNTKEGMLFSYDGNPNEIVDVSFEHARLDEKTIGWFEKLGIKLPSMSGELDYKAQESQKTSTDDEPCSTRVELRAAASQMPAEIHLFQLGHPGQEHYRYLEMTARGAELVSRIMTSSPSDSPLAPGCQKLLQVGDRNVPLNGTIGVTTIVADNSEFRLSFKPLKAGTNLWGDAAGFYEPFDLGSPQIEPTDPPAFQARAVSIRPHGSNDSSSVRSALASAQSASDGPLLTISGLRIGSDQLQLSVAGRGWVKTNGEYVSVNLGKRLEENKIIAGLLTAFNAALLAWVARLILKRPSRSHQASGRQEKGRTRRSQRRRKGSAKRQADD